jgi:hypothetical protein
VSEGAREGARERGSEGAMGRWIWDLDFGFWNLGFGIWNLMLNQSTNYRIAKLYAFALVYLKKKPDAEKLEI